MNRLLGMARSLVPGVTPRRGSGDRLLTAIEFGPTVVKVARARRGRGETRLLSLQGLDCLGLSDPEIRDRLKETMLADPEGPGEVILLLPLSQAMSRTLRLPSQQDDELREMVRLQVRLQVPLRSESISYGFRVASKDDDGYSTVYLAIVDQAIADRYVDILKAIGLEPDSVQLNTEGFLEFLRAPEAAMPPSPGSVMALVDVDQDATNIGIAVEGRLAFTRSLATRASDLWTAGAGEGASAHAKPAGLHEQLRRTFALFSQEAKQPGVSGIILSGAPEACRALHAGVAEALGLPVAALDASMLSSAEALTQAAPGPSEVPGVSWTALLGLVQRGGAAEIELLPEDLVRRRHARATRRAVLETAIRVVVLLALGALTAHQALSRREARLKSLDDEIRALMPVATRIEEIEERLEVINRRMESKGLVLDCLREVHTLAPPSMSLNRFSYARSKGAILKGTAAKMADVFAFTPKLEASPLFKNVLVGFASTRGTKDSETTDFQLNLSIEAKGRRDEIR